MRHLLNPLATQLMNVWKSRNSGIMMTTTAPSGGTDNTAMNSSSLTAETA